MSEDFSVPNDPSTPSGRILEIMAYGIPMMLMLQNDPTEMMKVESFAAKALGVGGSLEDASVAQREKIDRLFGDASEKAATAAYESQIMYKTSEEVANAMIRAIQAIQSKSQGGQHGL